MDSNPVLTIGITAFERPLSLERALESIFQQREVSRSEVELVVVDDASTSQEFCSYWKSLEDSGASSPFALTLLRHNVGTGGASAGRNDVIRVARGRYTLFLDDDNVLAASSLAALVDYLRGSSMQWVSLRRERGNREFYLSPAAQHENIDRPRALWTYLTCGAFETEFLRTNDIRFNPDVRLGEDAEFVLEVVTRATQLAALSDRTYFIESDPGEGEAPHISQSTRGDQFTSILLQHYRRMGEIIERSKLDFDEKRLLQEAVLTRTFYSYRLPEKIAGTRDEAFAQDALTKWSGDIQSFLTRDALSVWSSGRNNDAVVTAIYERDLGRMRALF